MKLMRKSRLTQAVASAALVAGLSMTAASSVYAAGPSYNPHGVGDVLLYPYYTVENNFLTLVHLVNNSSTHTVMAKIRFREFEKSVDVLDFNIVLSPDDVFTGFLRSNGSGGIEFRKTDNSCTSPHTTGSSGNGSGGTLSFGGTVPTTAHTGHIEVITMGAIKGTNGNADADALVAGAKHASNGVPADCGRVDNYFAPGTTNRIGALQAAVTATAAGTTTNASVNALSGHYALLNTARGISAAGRPLVIQDATTDMASGPLVNPCNSAVSANNLVCGQFPAQFFAPSMASLNGIDPFNGNLADNVRRFNEIEAAINGNTGGNDTPRLNTQNEWSANVRNGVSSEIVVTLPLKHIYNDTNIVAVNNRTSANIFAGSNGTSSAWDAVDDALRAGKGIFVDSGSNAGCVNYSEKRVNREESATDPAPTGGTVVSGPSVPTATPVVDNAQCLETQVYTFNGGVTNPSGAAFAVDTGTDSFGWFNVMFLDEDRAAITASQGIANTGLGFWQRNFGDATRNYGQIINNTRF